MNCHKAIIGTVVAVAWCLATTAAHSDPSDFLKWLKGGVAAKLTQEQLRIIIDTSTWRLTPCDTAYASYQQVHSAYLEKKAVCNAMEQARRQGDEYQAIYNELST